MENSLLSALHNEMLQPVVFIFKFKFEVDFEIHWFRLDVLPDVSTMHFL